MKKVIKSPDKKKKKEKNERKENKKQKKKEKKGGGSSDSDDGGGSSDSDDDGSGSSDDDGGATSEEWKRYELYRSRLVCEFLPLNDMALTHSSNSTIRIGLDAVELKKGREDVDGQREALKEMFAGVRSSSDGVIRRYLDGLKDLGELVRSDWARQKPKLQRNVGRRLKVFILPLSDYDSEQKDYSGHLLRSYVRVHYPSIRTRLDLEYLKPRPFAGATEPTDAEKEANRKRAKGLVQFDEEHERALDEHRHLRIGTYAFTGMVSSLAGVIFALVFNPVL